MPMNTHEHENVESMVPISRIGQLAIAIRQRAGGGVIATGTMETVIGGFELAGFRPSTVGIAVLSATSFVVGEALFGKNPKDKSNAAPELPSNVISMEAYKASHPRH